MILDDKAVAILEKVGMTHYGARAYAALVALGASPASQIAEVAGVPRSKVYDTLGRLEKDGWVTRTRGRPIVYRARYPAEAIDEKKTALYADIEYASTELSRVYDRQVDREAPKVLLFRGMENITARTLDMISRAKKDIAMLGALYGPEEIETIRRHLSRARKKGVSVRIITRKSIRIKDATIDLPSALKDAAPDLRLFNTPFIKFVIVDGKEILIMFSKVEGDMPDLEATVAVWIPGRDVASLMESNFDMMWELAETA